MRDGCRDAHLQLIKEGLMAIKRKIGNGDDKILVKLEGYVQEIETRIKVENGYDHQIEDFTRAVESLPDEVSHNGSIKVEKASLVNAAKQLKEIMIQAHRTCIHTRV